MPGGRGRPKLSLGGIGSSTLFCPAILRPLCGAEFVRKPGLSGTVFERAQLVDPLAPWPPLGPMPFRHSLAAATARSRLPSRAGVSVLAWIGLESPCRRCSAHVAPGLERVPNGAEGEARGQPAAEPEEAEPPAD